MLRLRSPRKDLGAGKSSSIEDEHAVALVTLGDYFLSCVSFDFFNCVEDDIELVLFKSIEHEGLEQFCAQQMLDLLGLGEEGGHEVFLLVVIAEDFSRNASSLLNRS